MATLQKNGLNSIGFSGADANLIPAHKRPVKKVDFGWVGDVETEKINAQFLEKVISENICPVFCAITHDGNGNLLNTNADTIASSLAVAISTYFEVNLAYCFEKNGVLENIDDDHFFHCEVFGFAGFLQPIPFFIGDALGLLCPFGGYLFHFFLALGFVTFLAGRSVIIGHSGGGASSILAASVFLIVSSSGFSTFTLIFGIRIGLLSHDTQNYTFNLFLCQC